MVIEVAIALSSFPMGKRTLVLVIVTPERVFYKLEFVFVDDDLETQPPG
jgi:hypothetical protein